MPNTSPEVTFPKIDKEMVKTNFFEYLDFVLQFAPAGPEEQAIRAKLARIGIGAGKTFDFKDLSVEHKAEVLLGMKEGETKVEQYLATGQKDINGWKIGSLFGDRAFFNGDWLKRAAAAKGGIYGNDAAEAIKNPINRYLINSPMLPGMKKNADGSLTLYIQKDSPGKAMEANWLPAPNDTIYLVMRLYWPKDTPPSILPPGEGTWQPPAVKQAS